MAWKHRDPWTRAPHTLALEPRIMFDASGAATYADVQETDAPADGAATVVDDGTAEVVFIDGTIEHYEALAKAWNGNAEVVVLDAQAGGLAQMAAHLSGRTGIAAIHVFTHGQAGALAFGSGVVDATNLAEHKAALEAIGASLTDDGDILLYGCYVGQDDVGAAFVDAIANLTGADIAASDDLTGGQAAGGDWTLEIATGAIDAANVAPALEASGFSGILGPAPGTITFGTSGSDILLAGPSSNPTASNVAGSGLDVAVVMNSGNSQILLAREPGISDDTTDLTLEISTSVSGGGSINYVSYTSDDASFLAQFYLSVEVSGNACVAMV